MKTDRFQDIAEKLLREAGITVNGNNPWDIQVHHPDFFRRVFREGSLGLGESYMDGWWDSPRLDEFFTRVLRARLDEKLKHDVKLLSEAILARLFNRQSRRRAFIIGQRHYDLGNELFRNMLDKGMNYSCGYWKNADNLDAAQENKLDLICRKLGLQPGMRVLDIGCGWGGFARFAAERYGAEVVGITVSREQQELGSELSKGLPVEIRLQDYRDLDEKFDRVVSIGMFEHVGYKNYRTYMKVVSRCLTDEGLFLLHTIGGNRSVKSTNPWTNKYIFPNSMLPSVAQIGRAIEGLLVMEDWHNFGTDYDKTLLAWHENFEKNWDRIKHLYDERFYRMWRYFLLSSAGGFRSRSTQLWQVVLSRQGVPGGYQSIR